MQTEKVDAVVKPKKVDSAIPKPEQQGSVRKVWKNHRGNLEALSYIFAIIAAIVVFFEYNQSQADRRRELAFYVWDNFFPSVDVHDFFVAVDGEDLSVVALFENDSRYPVNMYNSAVGWYSCQEGRVVIQASYPQYLGEIGDGGRFFSRDSIVNYEDQMANGRYLVVAEYKFESPLGNEFVEKHEIEMVDIHSEEGRSNREFGEDDWKLTEREDSVAAIAATRTIGRIFDLEDGIITSQQSGRTPSDCERTLKPSDEIIDGFMDVLSKGR